MTAIVTEVLTPTFGHSGVVSICQSFHSLAGVFGEENIIQWTVEKSYIRFLVPVASALVDNGLLVVIGGGGKDVDRVRCLLRAHSTEHQIQNLSTTHGVATGNYVLPGSNFVFPVCNHFMKCCVV